MSAKDDLLAARRTRKRRQGIVALPDGREALWTDVLGQARQLRASADVLEQEAVMTARVAGLSWDRISVALGGKPTGEALRLRYGRAVLAGSRDAVRRVPPAGRDAGPSR